MSRIYLLNVIDFLSSALLVIIFVRIILSWFPKARNFFTDFVYDVTEPILKPFRKLNPKGFPLDFSPIIVIILIELLRGFLRMIV